MGYRDSDDSNFSRHGMGRDAENTRFSERTGPQGYTNDDHRGGSPDGYRHEFEGRNDRGGRSYQGGSGHETSGQYGMNRGGASHQSESQGYPSRPGRDGGNWYGSQSRFGYDSDQGRSQSAWSAPYETQGFRDDASHKQQNQGHRDPDYQQWRDDQLRMLDDDYDTWRKERYQKFSDDFSQWRSSRTASASGQQQGQQSQKGSGSNNASSGASSGSAKSKDTN